MLFLQASELFCNKSVILSHLFFPEQAWAGVPATRKSGTPQPRSEGLNSLGNEVETAIRCRSINGRSPRKDDIYCSRRLRRQITHPCIFTVKIKNKYIRYLLEQAPRRYLIFLVSNTALIWGRRFFESWTQQRIVLTTVLLFSAELTSFVIDYIGGGVYSSEYDILFRFGRETFMSFVLVFWMWK